MSTYVELEHLFKQFVVHDNYKDSDYFGLIKELVVQKQQGAPFAEKGLKDAYALLFSEIKENNGQPVKPISFGTSGWRGILGKDLFAKSVAQVTRAILEVYHTVDQNAEMAALLGVASFEQAQKRGCVLGFDNRFGGEFLAAQVAKVLGDNGFVIHYCGESTTGVLSAVVLQLRAAFSINLTPSHNPLEYGGFKFNASDGGPAESEITRQITDNALGIVADDENAGNVFSAFSGRIADLPGVVNVESLTCWQNLVAENKDVHGLDHEKTIKEVSGNSNIVVAVDCVHGASRLHVKRLLAGIPEERLIFLRDEADVTFGGVAPEPSAENMKKIVACLGKRNEALKLGVIIDPDGDRIRFTDGINEISMNQFGAMAYHFLHSYKNKNGMVAKTVATSNLANAIADALSEEVFEPAVGFKNFRPVIGEALVIFEESDGISIIGHTPEKDAYIGLLLAMEMMLHTGLSLGRYLTKIEDEFGHYYPDRDGIVVAAKGEDLRVKLEKLNKYQVGAPVVVGDAEKNIAEILTIDGRKIIFDDHSWLMIRPSGTERKVRFYVESRSPEEMSELVEAAQRMLAEIGVID